MKFELMELPYEISELSPSLSQETMQYHHWKHLATYIDNLNKLIINTEFENLSLEEIIKKSLNWPIFNNSAQIWNHNFYFEALTSKWDNPDWKILYLINEIWWDLEIFKMEFNKMALSNFWSGWTWLVKDESGLLEIINTSNAWTPISENKKTPLLTCDVWEHAYYIDYRNRRAEYLENFWKIIDWKKIEERNY